MQISLAGWSLNRRFRRERDPLALLDFPRVAREEFGIGAIELNNRFFASTDAAYLERLKEAAAAHDVALVGMAVDGTGNPAALDEEERQQAVKRIRAWFPVAARLGLPYFRANTGGGRAGDPERQLAQCIASLRTLVEAAADHGVRLAIENHGGISSRPAGIMALLQGVNSPWLGTLPDFGNFPAEVRYDGIAQLAPYALGVHVKTYAFDDDGRETTLDVPRYVSLLRAAGYAGYWGIEYEGKGDDHAGVLRSKALLERCLAAPTSSDDGAPQRAR